MDLSGKRVLITGGSSGIGLALARSLAGRGARLLLAGRRETMLMEAAHGLREQGAEVATVSGDVADPVVRAAFLDAAKAFGGLDILVNNAGVVRAGRLEAMDEAEIRAMIEVDLLAPILLTRAALPLLRDSGEAMIVNVASGIALMGVPFYAAYAGAKAGIGRFGEALRRELAGEGIHVLTAYPGATDTPMMQSSQAGPDLGFTKEPAQDVAEAIVEGMVSDAMEVVRGGETRARMLETNRTDPAALDRRFLGLKPALEAAVRDHKAL
ncbi:SDR family NAD(P)-dependent oxidoreductase [Skermanella mucosa]|uniref:SDR family NAD(P)-dependent oxidoreductase n=1 Tax=Skermanella mucosa TaxID=1789672 RepID=UPI00192B969D|nr:SDR family NAD(P)-dependent oxidoreductase [Skermanella mucosa]UEM23629.1 SDR family NAD(P)-dependent oxidoreductase [Skermanella mucosa]